MLLMGGIIVLAAECMNTAIERVVDDVGTERRDAAKQAKDCGFAVTVLDRQRQPLRSNEIPVRYHQTLWNYQIVRHECESA